MVYQFMTQTSYTHKTNVKAKEQRFYCILSSLAHLFILLYFWTPSYFFGKGNNQLIVYAEPSNLLGGTRGEGNEHAVFKFTACGKCKEFFTRKGQLVLQ